MVAAVVAGRGWPYFDPEYETLNARINPPRVVIDNTSCETATIVKFDSLNRHGILLEVVQVLTDLDLSIRKAYISSDGGWFMDVFHVTDSRGNKLTDEEIIEHIEQSLGEKGISCKPAALAPRSIGVQPPENYTALELTGSDRPGLLAEISAVLATLGCNVAAAEVWTHNMRVACMLYITGGADGELQPDKLCRVRAALAAVMRGSGDCQVASSDGAGHAASAGADVAEVTHTERRLHQMMLAERDYEPAEGQAAPPPCCTAAAAPPPAVAEWEAELCCSKGRPAVSVRDCVERGYSVVNVHCLDRPKLLFDVVCTLTDMQYVVFHATINCDGPFASQEYYIRHVDGYTVDTPAERRRVIKCLEAAISRRASQGVRLELCTPDRLGLLSEVTGIFCKHGLAVARAEVSTRDGMAVNSFYVTDVEGNAAVGSEVLDAVRKEIGHTVLHIAPPALARSSPLQQQPRQSQQQQLQQQLLQWEDERQRHSEQQQQQTSLSASLGSFFRSHSERLLCTLGLKSA